MIVPPTAIPRIPPKPLFVALDFAYGGMSKREIASLATQTMLCHHTTRQHSEHVRFALVGAARSLLNEEFEGLGIASWSGVTQYESLSELGRPIVYLSPDADVALGDEEDDAFDQDVVFVVGALIDREVRPNASRERAFESGAMMRRLPTERLPPQSLDTTGRAVRLNALNVNAVVQTLVEYTHCGDWPTALLRGLGTSQRHISDAVGEDPSVLDTMGAP